MFGDSGCVTFVDFDKTITQSASLCGVVACKTTADGESLWSVYNKDRLLAAFGEEPRRAALQQLLQMPGVWPACFSGKTIRPIL